MKLCFAVTAILGWAGFADGSVLFYGGQTVGGRELYIGSPFAQYEEVYDDFDLLASANIESVFVDAYGSTSPTGGSGRFEIRSGLADGNSGTLVQSGEGITYLAEPLSGGVPSLGPHNRFRMDVPDFLLAPGRYWIMIYMQVLVQISATQGINGVGGPLNNQNAFVTSPRLSSAFFSPIVGGDFGYGVEGTVVPEPLTGLAMALGTFGVLRRQSRRIRIATLSLD